MIRFVAILLLVSFVTGKKLDDEDRFKLINRPRPHPNDDLMMRTRDGRVGYDDQFKLINRPSLDGDDGLVIRTRGRKFANCIEQPTMARRNNRFYGCNTKADAFAAATQISPDGSMCSFLANNVM